MTTTFRQRLRGTPLHRIALRGLQEGRNLRYLAYYCTTLRRDPYQFVHILSHVRSGSTLLSHLLTSSPAICGFGETMLPYRRSADFRLVIGRVLMMLERFPEPGNERYLLDKLLHNQLLSVTNIPLLVKHQSHIIFHLREPRGTLSSLMKFWRVTDQEAARLYANRLRMLSAYAQALPAQARCAFITHDQLMNRTQEVFVLLEDFLALPDALSEQYALLPTTGKAGGDRSQYITKGHIVRDRISASETSAISNRVLKFATAAYQMACGELAGHCRCLNRDGWNLNRPRSVPPRPRRA